jgi:hypothetical protein
MKSINSAFHTKVLQFVMQVEITSYFGGRQQD